MTAPEGYWWEQRAADAAFAAMTQAEQHAVIWPPGVPCHDRDCALHNPAPGRTAPVTTKGAER